MQAFGRNLHQLSVDRIDTLPEVYLGLSATCCCSAFICVILIPFFDFVGMGWIRTWEGRHAILYPEANPGECTDALKFKYVTPAQAFAAADGDHSGDVSEVEWRAFAKGLNKHLVANGGPTMRPMPCWQEFDLNLDGSSFRADEFYKVVGSQYHWEDDMNAVKFRAELAKKFGSTTRACDLMDKDNDTQVNLTEFQNVSLQLKEPPSSKNSWRLFSHMDSDANGLLSMSECHMSVSGVKIRLKNTFGNLTAGCSALDTNGDGAISQDEFVTHAAKLTPPISKSDAISLYPKLDRDKDGTSSIIPDCHVDFKSFKARVQAAGPCVFFNISDVDQNGILSAGEFVEAGAHLSPPVDALDMGELFGDSDTNGNSKVEISEIGCSAAIVGTMQFVAFVPKNIHGWNTTVDSWFESSLTAAVSTNPLDQAKVVEHVTRRLDNKESSDDEAPARDLPSGPSVDEMSLASATTTEESVTSAARKNAESDKQVSTTAKATTTEKSSAKSTTTDKATTTETPSAKSTTTQSTTIQPTTTALPSDYCNDVDVTTPGVEKATINLKYNLQVESLKRVGATIKHLENIKVSTGPEYSKLYWALAQHGICLQFLKEVTPPSCSGGACPGAYTTHAPSTTTTTATTVEATTSTSTTAASTTATTATTEAETKAETTTTKPAAKTEIETTTEKPTTVTTTTRTFPPTTTITATTINLSMLLSQLVPHAPVAPASQVAAPLPLTTAITLASTSSAPSNTVSQITAPITPLAGPDVETPITGKYTSMPSTVTGFMQVYFNPASYASEGLQWPSQDTEIEAQVTPILENVMETLFKQDITVTKTVVGQLPGSILTDGVALSKEANVTLQGSLPDTQAVIDEVQHYATQIHDQIATAFAASQVTWANYIHITYYIQVDYTITATGEKLVQRTGQRNGDTQTYDGSTPVAIPGR